jgi:hypothetical protein
VSASHGKALTLTDIEACISPATLLRVAPYVRGGWEDFTSAARPSSRAGLICGRFTFQPTEAFYA